MTKTKKYVRILKAPNKASWYANKIGQVFEVERDGCTYLIRKGPHHLTAVRQEDAELIVTEKRPAKVGERVLITAYPYERSHLYDKYQVIYPVSSGSYAVHPFNKDVLTFLNHEQYEVIVNNEVKNEEADGMKIDLNAMGYDELIAHGEAVMQAIRLRSYDEGYKQGKLDADMDATHSPEKEELPYDFSDEDIELAI
ncbi:hypothetical protein LC766_23785, partial [Bacillus licheniformis]|nr:hypothetical protein [Bacillus licheniformis]